MLRTMASGRPPVGVFVERDSELETALASARAAVEGSGSLTVLRGDAGQGKTELLRRISHAVADDMTVLAATAGELEGDVPFGVLCRLLDRVLMGLDEVAAARVSSGPAATAARHVLGAREAGTVAPAAMRTSFYWLLDGLAALGPLLIAIDDAQWADPDSLQFVTMLADRVPDLPIAVLVAARDVRAEGRSPALAAVLAHRDAVHLDVPVLSGAGVGDVLGAGADPALIEAAHELTGGNAFLVNAVAALVASGTWTTDTLRTLAPTSVVDSVIHRLAGLPATDAALARALAVLEQAPLRTIGALAGVPLTEAAAGIDRLRDVGLVASGSPVAYRHALLRTAVLAALDGAELDALRRAAARLLADGPRGVELAAAQLLASEGVGDPWAVTTLTAAADAALAAGAPTSAVALLRRAVAEPPEPAARPQVLVELGLAELRAADPACVLTLDEAARSVAEAETRARCALALASAYGYAGFHVQAAAALERALEDPAGVHPELRHELEAGLVAASLLVPERIAEARALLSGHGALTGATRGERLLLIQLASNASGTNQHADEIRRYARAAIGDWETAEQQPESTEWAWARLFLSAAGEYDVVRRLTDRAAAEAASSGSVLGAVTVWFVRGMTQWWSGDLLGAEGYFQAMLDHGELVDGGMLVRTLAAGGLAQTLSAQGRVEEALELVGRFPEELDSSAPANGVVQLLRARAMTRAAAGDHAGAVAAAHECGRRLRELDVDSPTWASWRSLAVEPLLAQGAYPEAQRLAAEELVLAERSGVPRIRGLALRLAAVAAQPPDLALLREAVAVLAGSGAELEEAKAYVALGAALRRQGQRGAAREMLARGRAQAARCGAHVLVAEATAELDAAGARPRRLEVSGVGALTASELRVCELAAAGMRNREIAQRLFVTAKTVEVHLSHSYRKLGASGRDELAGLLTRFRAG